MLEWPPKVPHDFPLTVVARGYMKRVGRGQPPRWICGKRTPEEALRIWHRMADAALAPGREQPAPLDVPEPVDKPTVEYILTRWLIDCRGDSHAGRMSLSAYRQYKLSARRIREAIGHLCTDDVSPDVVRELHERFARRHGADFARRGVGHLRACCRHADDMGWCRPVRLGHRQLAKLTRRPPARMKWKLYTPEQVRMILAACDRVIVAQRRKPSFAAVWVQLRAMILLALNGGYGATELSRLPREIIDLDAGMIDYARGKTGKQHVVPLWPETIAALRPVLSQRPGDDLLFRTREGKLWAAIEEQTGADGKVRQNVRDNVRERFNQLTADIGLRIRGQSFYKLRHLFATIADRSKDRNALSVLMGHALPGARGHYIEVGVDRLREVVESVRQHILNPKPTYPAGGGGARRRGGASRGKRARRRAECAAASTGG